MTTAANGLLFMTSARQLRLGAFMRPASIHTGAWRYPGAWPDMNFNYAHIKECIQKLERAKFDAFFMADHMAVLNMPMDALKRSHTSTSFEPFTLLSALSQVDRAHRARRHRLDHVRCALSHRAALRLARLDQRRPRRLEYRHHLQSGRRAQFRARRAYGARRALSPRARVLRRGDRAVGQLGRRCLRPRRRGRHFLRSGENARARSQGQIFLGARPAQYRAADPGLAGDRAGRRVGIRPPACGGNRGSGVHRAERPWRSARNSMPTSRAAWKSSAARAST